jgi:signal transduction histidine kinase
MQKVVTGIQTASQIAQAVLGFAGRPDEPHTANVLKTVELSIECIGRDPRKDKVNVAIDVPSNLVVCMRPLALQQVLMNLILNARAALRKRGGAIKITASADQNYAKLVVADNGPGIADHVLSRIFEPFITDSQRSGNNGKGKGTGLGLAICRRLVEEANGTISAQTSAETGTIFTISLPKHAQLRAIA